MLKTYLKSSILNRFIRDEKGTAAIEFAFIAPVMVVTYFGLASVSLLVSADRDVSHATSVTADLFTQSESLDGDDIEDIFNATLAVLGLTPTQAANVTIDVISYEMDGGGTLNEIGYTKLGSGFPSKFVPPNNISSSLINSTSGLVITRIEYEYVGSDYYKADLTRVVSSPTLSETFMLKPRKSTTIPFSSGGSSTVSCSLITVSGEPRASC
ncbi:MAG: pilus assembly protein [Robiginitomaculum sp.]|nr:pilus assembly protein [Robiginitomaculum sp.]